VEEEQHPADDVPLATRTVADVDSLRALADPTRMAILAALMDASQGDLPVMSVKELAAHLGQPPTKLYRHMKQLEAAGLIRVAATRLVSGIVEQRYQACQRDLMFDGGFMREHADESEAAIRTLLDSFREGYFTAFRDKRLAPDAVPEAEPYRRPMMFFSEARVSPSRAAEIRARLQELTTWLDYKDTKDPDGILVDILIGYYAPVEHNEA
jgi:DNA-binding transcriptional ArsR family regulator